MFNNIKSNFFIALKNGIVINVINSLIITISAFYMIEKYMEFYVKHVFIHITSIIGDEAEFILKQFGDDEKINILIASVWITGYSFLLTYTSLYIITISALVLITKMVYGFSLFKKFILKYNIPLMNEVKLIGTWTILYTLGNHIILMFGFSNFVYKMLALLCQFIVYFLLTYNNCFGFKIKIRDIPLKRTC